MNRELLWPVTMLAIIAVAAAGAFTAAHHQPVWIMLLPCVALPWSRALRIERAPDWLVRLLRSAAQFTCVAVVVLGVFLSEFPVNPEFGPRRTTIALGYWITLLVSVFLMGVRLWPPASALIPLLLSLLAMACFELGVNLEAPVAVAGVSMFVYLTLTPGQSASRVRLRRLAFQAAASVAFALAVTRGIWLAQGWVERNLFPMLTASASGSFTPSMLPNSELGSLEELKLSPRVVMRVWSERPQKLRARVFTYYDGKAWHPHLNSKDRPDLFSQAFASEPGRGFALAADESGSVATTIVPRSPNHLILAPAGALAVQAGVPALRMDAYQVLTWSDEVPDRYVVRHRREGRIVQPGDGPLPRWPDSGERMRQACLIAPQNLDARIQELADQLGRGASSPEQRLRHTLEFLERDYTYSLKPGKFHTGDPLSEFLFEKKQGYCEYFATAAAVLLRLEGVPTRYITGYSVQAGNRIGDHYVVREKDAHAWIEVFLPGAGWVEADPTPPAEYEAMVAGVNDSWFDRVWEWLQTTASELWSLLRHGDWRGLLRMLWSLLWRAAIALALAWGIIVAWRWWKRRVPATPGQPPVSSGALDPALTHLLAELDRRWAALGVARPASRAPLEHAQSLPPLMRDASLPVVDCFYRGCFAGAPLRPEEVAGARAALDREFKRLGPLTNGLPRS